MMLIGRNCWDYNWLLDAIALGFIVASCVGCSTIGSDFELENANLVQNGMTRDQVIAIMGSPPSEVEGSDTGALVWLYSWASAVSLGTEMKKVRFTFDENGKVYGIPKTGIVNLNVN